MQSLKANSLRSYNTRRDSRDSAAERYSTDSNVKAFALTMRIDCGLNFPFSDHCTYYFQLCRDGTASKCPHWRTTKVLNPIEPSSWINPRQIVD